MARSADTARLSRPRFASAIACAVAAAVAVWWPLSIPLEGFLPSPLDFAQAFVESVQTPELYQAILATSRRILIGWVGAVVIGSCLGIWMGRSRIVDALALPWVMIGLAIPAPVIIIFSILFFGLEESSTLLALVVSVTPFIVNIVYQGVRSMDPSLTEMADVYHLSRTEHLRQVILPQIAPSLMAAVRFGFAMTWKIVVIVEALSQPNGIGGQIELFFRLLRPADVLAWTFCFTIIMVLLEVLVFRTVEHRLFRWRVASQF